MVGQKRTINQTDTETESVDPQSNKEEINALKRTEPFGEKSLMKRFQKEICKVILKTEQPFWTMTMRSKARNQKSMELPKKSKNSSPKTS